MTGPVRQGETTSVPARAGRLEQGGPPSGTQVDAVLRQAVARRLVGPIVLH